MQDSESMNENITCHKLEIIWNGCHPKSIYPWMAILYFSRNMFSIEKFSSP